MQIGQKLAKIFGSTKHSEIPKQQQVTKSPSSKPKLGNRITFLFSLIGKPLYYLSLGILLLFLLVIPNLIGNLYKLFFARIPRVILNSFQDRLLTAFSVIPTTVRLFKLPTITFKYPKLPSLPHFHFPRLRLHPFLLFLLIITITTSSFYYWILKDLPSPQKLANLKPDLTTQIFDRNGVLLYKIYANEKRTLVTLDDIPPYVRQATIAIEDKNFYQHQGFSLIGIGRALKRNFNSGSLEGGSTITQQLIKNTLLSRERTLTRKVKEIILAIHTELIFDKDEILTMYFNQVGFGGPAYGIQEASQQYFNKGVKDLNLAEAAFLAGLPQAPTRYSPFGAHPELSKQRQLQVLSRMVEDKYISPAQKSEAAITTLKFASPVTSIKTPHFVMYLKDLLVNQLGEDLVNKGGLQVHTTLDLALQNQAEDLLSQELEPLKHLKVNNGAILITQPKTGEILAMVGSKDYFDVSRDGQVNLTTSLRQPGSAVKPINYALALEKGYTPASVILDAPITFNMIGSPPWSPKNYDGRFHGNVTLRTALASSYNIPATKLLALNGVREMVILAQDLGITTWDDPSRFGLSLTLGSNEVKMTDMAEVYGTFANLGVHVPLTPIIEVTDSKGKPINFSPCDHQKPSLLNNTVQAASYKCLPQSVISPTTAYLISDILSDNQARSPAFGQNSVLNIKNNQVAVKTGTSNDLRDNWTIGYTSDYLVATWVGNNDNTPMSNIASGITGASPIWAKIIQSLLQNTPHATFPLPQNIVQVKVCTLTGTLTCKACPQTRTESFAKGSEPQKSCTDTEIATILNQQKEKNKETKKVTGQILPFAASTSR